jgi:hypothetical protein
MRPALALLLALLLPLAACSGGTRSATPANTTVTTTTTTTTSDPPPDRPHIDGTEGAICAWGERRTDPAPRPEPCAEGLTCCYPCGIQGCDSVCTNVEGGMCPAYP